MIVKPRLPVSLLLLPLRALLSSAVARAEYAAAVGLGRWWRPGSPFVPTGVKALPAGGWLTACLARVWLLYGPPTCIDGGLLRGRAGQRSMHAAPCGPATQQAPAAPLHDLRPPAHLIACSVVGCAAGCRERHAWRRQRPDRGHQKCAGHRPHRGEPSSRGCSPSSAVQDGPCPAWAARATLHSQGGCARPAQARHKPQRDVHPPCPPPPPPPGRRGRRSLWTSSRS